MGRVSLPLCHCQRENHGCYLDDHPWSSYSISFKRPWLVAGLSRVLPDLFQNHHIFWFPVGVPISPPFAARCYHVLCASREPPRATPGSNGGRWWCPLRHICMAWRLWLRRNSNEGTSRNGRMHISRTSGSGTYGTSMLESPLLMGLPLQFAFFSSLPFFCLDFRSLVIIWVWKVPKLAILLALLACCEKEECLVSPWQWLFPCNGGGKNLAMLDCRRVPTCQMMVLDSPMFCRSDTKAPMQLGPETFQGGFDLAMALGTLEIPFVDDDLVSSVFLGCPMDIFGLMICRKEKLQSTSQMLWRYVAL